MSSVQILDRLGSAAFTIAVVALLLLFVPRLVRADVVRVDVVHADMVHADAGWMDKSERAQ